MTIPVDLTQNNYSNNASFKLVSTQNVLLEGRMVQKLTYRNSHSLIWKIGQVVLAVLLTMATLGLAFCFLKGIIWKKSLALFKDRIVFQNHVTQPANQPLLIANLSPADLASQQKIKDMLRDNPEYGNAVQAWEKVNVSLSQQLARLRDLRQYAFGTDQWSHYFGNIIGDIPPLPADIYQIYNSTDHSTSGKKIKDTHVLVLVPQAVMVKGKTVDITLKNLGELVKTPDGGGTSTNYDSTYFSVKDLADEKITKSHWTLMRKEILPGSNQQHQFSELVEMVEEYSRQANAQYSIPNAIDVVACCFLHYVSTGRRLFDAGEYMSPFTYTRCQELAAKKFPVLVGTYSTSGLHAFGIHPNNGNNVGVVPLRTF